MEQKMKFNSILLIILLVATAGAAVISGGFEGCNVVDINQTSPNNFTCKLSTPTMAVPSSFWYNIPGNHYHYWFMLKIENSAGQPVTVSILNADWGGSSFWGRKAVYTEAPDPNALSAESTWTQLASADYSDPIFTDRKSVV